MKVSKVGIAWYRESEYDELRKLFVDSDRWASTYAEWLPLAEKALKKLQDEGQVVVKAYIHLNTFPEWCKKRGLPLDSKARMAFANEFANNDDSQE